jgi:hypothetical protein
MKVGCSPSVLSSGLPNWFGEFLTYSRSLDFGQTPDYEKIRSEIASLVEDFPDTGPLDWTPCHPETVNPFVTDPEVDVPDDANVLDLDSERLGDDSYYGDDVDSWTDMRCGERNKDLTLPATQEEDLDKKTLVIAHIDCD